MIFKIKKALLIPLALDSGLVFILVLLSIVKKGYAVQIFSLVLLLAILLALVLECIFREVTISEDGLTIRKVLRRRQLGWGDITDVGSLVMRKRAYLVLTTTKGFHIISNAYDDYERLVRGIVERVDAQRIEESVKTLIDAPVKKISDIVSAWVGAAVLLAVVLFNIFFTQ